MARCHSCRADQARASRQQHSARDRHLGRLPKDVLRHGCGLGHGPFLPGCSLAAPTLPRRGSELYDFDCGHLRRYRRMIQEATAAVFPSLPVPERAPYTSSQGSENRGSACRVGDTLRTSKYPILTVYKRARSTLRGVMPEIDIWCVANLSSNAM